MKVDETPDAQERQLLALVAAVAEREGASDHAVRKRLGIAMSELNRLLVLLGADTSLGGLDLVTVREVDGRRQLRLTDKGRALCQQN